jgi:hypothetical protein
MPTLMERVTTTPPRVAGAPDWFTELPPAHQREIRDLVATRLRDDGSVQHSNSQLAEILIEHFGLPVKLGTVRSRLAQLTREIQQCPPRASKKK